MQVREARVEDARDIAESSVRGWQEGYKDLMPAEFLAGLSVDDREPAWRQGLSDGSERPLVAEEGGQVCGFLVSGPSRDEDAAPGTAEVMLIYVKPSSWRRGAGRALWMQARERLRGLGFARLTVWVLAKNDRGRRFYESMGCELDPGASQVNPRPGFALEEVRYRQSL